MPTLNTKNPDDIPLVLREAALRLGPSDRTGTASILHETAAKIAKVLAESSLSRVYQHFKDKEFVILTAWRAASERSENEGKLRDLVKEVRDAGYGFTRIEGRGQELKGKEMVQVQEPSILIVNETKAAPKEPGAPHGEKTPSGSRNDFKDWARKLAGKYEQNFFIHNDKGRAALVRVSDGSNEMNFSSFHAAAGEFYSKLGGKLAPPDPNAVKKAPKAGQLGKTEKPFHLEGREFVSVRFAEPPSSVMEGMGWQAQGQRGPYESGSSHAGNQDTALVKGLLNELGQISGLFDG